MSPGAIDSDKIGVTAGLGYDFGSFHLDLAYARLAGEEREISTSQVLTRITNLPANGTYNISTHVLGVGVSYFVR